MPFGMRGEMSGLLKPLPTIGIASLFALASVCMIGCGALTGLDGLTATSCFEGCDGGEASDASQGGRGDGSEPSTGDTSDRLEAHVADVANPNDVSLDSVVDAADDKRPTDEAGNAEADALWADVLDHGDAPDAQTLNGGTEAGVAPGQCSPGHAIIGVSAEVGSGRMHSVLCGGYPNIYNQSAACHPLYFDGHPGFPDNNPTPWPYADWDPNSYKTECATNEYVAGIYLAVTTGRVDGVVCCPGLVTHAACGTQLFFGHDSPAYAPPDWDMGYVKGQCPPGQYVSGISALTGVGTGPIVTLSFAPQSARYIRVTQTGAVYPYFWTIAELNVGGPSGTLSRTGWVPSCNTGGPDPPANALDGNTATHWSTGAAQVPGQWFQVDMTATRTFTQVTLDTTSNATDYPRGYQVNVSADGVNWGTPVAAGASFAGAPNRIRCCSP
jgi:hypothetical protein